MLCMIETGDVNVLIGTKPEELDDGAPWLAGSPGIGEGLSHNDWAMTIKARFAAVNAAISASNQMET